MTSKSKRRRVLLVSTLFIVACLSYGYFFYSSQQSLLTRLVDTQMSNIQGHYQRENIDETARLAERTDSVCGTIAKLCAVQLKNSQEFSLLKEGLATTLEPFMDYSEIAAIEVRDRNNRGYISMWREGGQVQFRTNYLLPGRFREKYASVSKPTQTSDGALHGTVTAYVDRDAITRAADRRRDELRQSADAEAAALRRHFSSTLFIQGGVLAGGIVFVIFSTRLVGRSYLLIDQQRRELEVFNRQLEQRVDERTQQLAAEVAKVSELNKGLETEVSERKNAEHKYRAIFENANEGIFQTTPEGKIISANRAMADILGYASPEELQEAVSDLGATIYADPARRGEALATLEREAALSQFEVAAKKQNGSAVWLSINARRVRDACGSITLIEGTLVDITSRKVAESERQELQRRLLDASRQAGMAEVATGVLHNVGNVLNSVNVATAVACERIKKSRVSRLAQVADLIAAHPTDLAEFISTDERGRKVPGFIIDLSAHLTAESKELYRELQTVSQHIEHIKEIVNLQQNHAGLSSILEPLDLCQTLDDALKISEAALVRHDIRVVRAFKEVPAVLADRHKVLQILVNILGNAKQALATSPEKVLTLSLGVGDGDGVEIRVCDTGCGIAPENLRRVFTHGFTTKSDGHGFGLHSSILAAKEMNATLTVHSEGAGRGATFVLAFPPAPTRVAIANAAVPPSA